MDSQSKSASTKSLSKKTSRGRAQSQDSKSSKSSQGSRSSSSSGKKTGTASLSTVVEIDNATKDLTKLSNDELTDMSNKFEDIINTDTRKKMINAAKKALLKITNELENRISVQNPDESSEEVIDSVQDSTESDDSEKKEKEEKEKKEARAVKKLAKNKNTKAKTNTKGVKDLATLSDAVYQLTTGKNSFNDRDLLNFLYSRSSKGKEEGEKYKTFLYEHYKKPFLSADGKRKTKLNRAFKSNIDFIEELVNIQRNLNGIFDKYSKDIGLKLGNHELDKDILKNITHWISLRLTASRNYYRAQGIRAPNEQKSVFSGKFPAILTPEGKDWVKSEIFKAPLWDSKGMKKKYEKVKVETESLELLDTSLLKTKGYATGLTIRSLVEIALQGRKGPSADEIKKLSGKGEDVETHWKLTDAMVKVVKADTNLMKKLEDRGFKKNNKSYYFTEQGQKIIFAAALAYKKKDIESDPNFTTKDKAFVNAKKSENPSKDQQAALDQTESIRIYSKGVSAVMKETKDVKNANAAQKAAGVLKKKKERENRNEKKDKKTGRVRK